MIRKCPECKGKGYIVVNYKICEACGGTGYKDFENVKEHVKGIPKNTLEKFDLDEEHGIPCDVCDGKGEIEVRETCKKCKGKGEINVCPKCGKIIKPGLEYCSDCKKKTSVYVLHPACDIEDVEAKKIYRGEVGRIERYGVFVKLNDRVWGLMKDVIPQNYEIGQKVFVKVLDVRPHKGEIDLQPVTLTKPYEIVKVKKEIERTKAKDINEKLIGKTVRVVGEVIQVQQTSGPTLFTIADETDTVWAAAFDEPGIRAYPHIKTGNIVEVIGTVNQHGGKVQIEVASMERLIGKDATRVRELINEAIEKWAEPQYIELYVKSDVLNKLHPKLVDAARTIRRAIFDGRPILVRHHADADGICAGVAIEKAVLPLIRKINPDPEAEWHCFRRSPSKAPFYELEDVVKDLSMALEDCERYDQKLPLLILLDNGSTEEDLVSLMKTKVYDLETVVVDHHYPGEVVDGKVIVDDYVDVHVNPYLVGGDSEIPAGALASEISKMINPKIKDMILHIPGIAAVGDRSQSLEAERYIKLAESKGYSKKDLEKIAACLDFEAFYLRFRDGRGIIDTLLGFSGLDKQRKLVEIVYNEYKRKVKEQLKAALPHVKSRKLPNGIILNVLDVEKYSHKFTFPAPGKTCGFVHDHFVQKKGENTPIVTLAYGPDFAVVRSTETVYKEMGFNLNKVISELKKEIPEASIDGGGHEGVGSMKYVEGLSKKVLESFAKKIAALKP